MNFAVEGRVPAFRENTVESFLQAAAAGATFVEFDVQVHWTPIFSLECVGCTHLANRLSLSTAP